MLVGGINRCSHLLDERVVLLLSSRRQVVATRRFEPHFG
jgi:hypothetical protein